MFRNDDSEASVEGRGALKFVYIDMESARGGIPGPPPTGAGGGGIVAVDRCCKLVSLSCFSIPLAEYWCRMRLTDLQL